MMYTLPANIETLPAIQSYKEGVAFLNKWFPGWYRHIDIDVLDMEATEWCIFGQLAKVTSKYNVDEDGENLYRVFFNKESFWDGQSVFSFACFDAGVETVREHNENWKRIIKDLRSSPEVSSEQGNLQKQLEEAKALVKDLEDKIEQERKKNEVITLTLTRAEIEGLLNRRVGAVKEKILNQLANS